MATVMGHEQSWLQLKNEITAKTAILEFGAVEIAKRVVHDPGLFDMIVTRAVNVPVHPKLWTICRDQLLQIGCIGRADRLAMLVFRQVALSQSEKGRKKALALIAKHAGPVYEADPSAPDLIVERRADGSIRRGRFANRQFIPVE